MAKRKTKVKIKLADDEQYVIAPKTACSLIFQDKPDDPTQCSVKLYLPKEEDMAGKEYSQAFTLAMAISSRLVNEPEFGRELVDWVHNKMAEAQSETDETLSDIKSTIN